MKIKIPQESLALLIATIALVMSTTGFYLQWYKEESELQMQILSFDVAPPNKSSEIDTPKSPVCSLNIAIFNPGNRDSALMNISLGHGTVNRTSHNVKYSSDIFPSNIFPDDYTAHIIKAGEISFLKLKFQRCTTESIQENIKSKGYSFLSIKTLALNHRGKRSRVRIKFVNTSISKDQSLKFSIYIDGHFDLQKHGFYDTTLTSRRHSEMTIKEQSDGNLEIHVEHGFNMPVEGIINW